jgi:hypothetical protein
MYRDGVMGTLVPEVYFYYFHCEGERKNKPLEPGYVMGGHHLILILAYNWVPDVGKHFMFQKYGN